ncbi:hypothetical protein F4055_13705 [Candidatus Poribacteria bacterium]|nr:hypothetical protein [Candidatus Poribacteria bacterium]
MSVNTSEYPRGNTQAKTPPFTQTIALSGDRAGSKGAFQFAGFAWIYDTKVTFVQGGTQSLKTPQGWRQLLRLISLARRLKKPIVLWNLPIIHIATKQRKTSLANTQAIQNVELALLKLPHPIITVFDETYDRAYPPWELIWSDGVVCIGSPDIQSSESEKVKIARCPTEIASAILELLSQAEAVPTIELIENRSASLRQMFAEDRAEVSAKLPSQ